MIAPFKGAISSFLKAGFLEALNMEIRLTFIRYNIKLFIPAKLCLSTLDKNFWNYFPKY